MLYSQCFLGQLSITIYCALDCMPSLGMLTINAFTASTSVLIVTDFFRCPSLDCKTCRGWLTYCAVR